MLWRKPADMKYTQMCQYIDENIDKIGQPGQYPDIEDTCYNYLWLLTKALAIKKRMFQDFEDYDGYAFYASKRLYNAIVRNWENQGTIIKGKKIRPIKNILDYTKHLLYPMKIEYQRESFAQIISEEFTSKKFDAFAFKEQLKINTEQAQSNVYLKLDIEDTIKSIPVYVDEVLKASPFNKNTLDYKKLRLSLLLNFRYSIYTKGFIDRDPVTIILWNLPKSLAGYVRVLLTELYTKFKQELLDCFRENAMDDDLLEKIIATPTGVFKDEYEEQ